MDPNHGGEGTALLHFYTDSITASIQWDCMQNAYNMQKHFANDLFWFARCTCLESAVAFQRCLLS